MSHLAEMRACGLSDAKEVSPSFQDSATAVPKVDLANPLERPDFVGCGQRGLESSIVQIPMCSTSFLASICILQSRDMAGCRLMDLWSTSYGRMNRGICRASERTNEYRT